MFNWTDQSIKGRLQTLTIKFEPAGALTGDMDYQLGYMDGAKFIPIRACTLTFNQAGVIAAVEAIQATSTPAEAKAAIEDLLVNALSNASPE